MKKSKLSLGLVTAFIASAALTGCSSVVTSKDDSLLTFTGHDGVTYDVITDAMYKDYLTDASGISDFYDKILEVLIRYEFEYGKSAKTDKSFETIVQEAQNNVKAQKNTAKQNANTNGTSYETEWDSILDSYGVEDEKQLKEHFVYQIEKTQLEDWFLETEEADLVKQFIGIEESGTNAGKAVEVAGYPDLVSRLPYHIRHILVKIDADGNNYTTGTITEGQAIKLGKIAQLLKTGINTFGNVALTQSDDSSKSNYGDVGIMTNNASSEGTLDMFAEFQLGIYVYDALVKHANANFVGVTEGLGLSAKVKDFVAHDIANTSFTNIPGLTEVPYSVFEDLLTVADVEADEAGLKVANGNAVAYPRNVLYNRYLNHHNPFIITNASRTSYANMAATDFATLADNKVNPDTVNVSTRDTSIVEKTAGTTGFKSAYALGLTATEDGTKVLTDENDNVIIGLRSASGGIHFIIVQKSIFDVNDGTGDNVSLAQYYTTKIPSDTDYPKDSNGNAKSTYVNFINSRSDNSVYSSRATTVKDKIKSFDPTYQYRLYEWLIGEYGDRLQWHEDLDLNSEIENYINNLRTKNKVSQEDGMALAWDKYIELIEAQNASRGTKDADGAYTRVIPEGCVIGFKQNLAGLDPNSDLYKAYQKGGMCYYGE